MEEKQRFLVVRARSQRYYRGWDSEDDEAVSVLGEFDSLEEFEAEVDDHYDFEELRYFRGGGREWEPVEHETRAERDREERRRRESAEREAQRRAGEIRARVEAAAKRAEEAAAVAARARRAAEALVADDRARALRLELEEGAALSELDAVCLEGVFDDLGAIGTHAAVDRRVRFALHQLQPVLTVESYDRLLGAAVAAGLQKC